MLLKRSLCQVILYLLFNKGNYGTGAGILSVFLNTEMYGQTAFDGSMVVSKTCNLLLDVRVI